MKSALAYLALLVLSLAVIPANAWGFSYPFSVSKLQVSGNRVRRGAWLSSDQLARNGKLRLAVVATWCPHCKKLIKKLARNAALRRKVDAVVILDSDLDSGLAEGGITGDKARSLREKRLNEYGMAIAYIKPLKGNGPLPMYVASARDVRIRATPSFFLCGDGACRPMPAKQAAPLMRAGAF